MNRLPAPVGYPGSAAYTPPGYADDPAYASLNRDEPALTLLEVLLRHKRRLIGCVVAALLLGAAYQMLAPRKYESTAEVFIEQARDNQSDSPLAASGVSAGQPSTHASLLKSTPVLEAALEAPAVDQATFFEGESDRVGHLRKHLDIGFSKDRETLTVSLRTGVPEESAAIINAVIDAYLRTQQSRVRVLDQEQLFAAEPRKPAGVMDDRMVAARLMMLSEALTRAQVTLTAAEARYKDAEVASADVTQLAAMLDAAGLDSRAYGMTQLAYLRAELARLDQQLEGMPPSWGPEHQLRGPVQRQADALRHEIETTRRVAAGAMLSLLETNRQQARRRVDEIAAQLGVEEVSASRVARLPVVVIERGEVPLKKAAPLAPRTMGIALFLGLALGVMWVLYIELNNQPGTPQAREGELLDRATPTRMRVHHEAMAALPVPQPERSLMLLQSDDVSNELAASHVPMLGMVPQVAVARSLTSPDIDDTASSIHQVRAVLQVQAGSKGTRAYAFTSPRRGAGKTSVTIGIATSLAMSGTRTLVVDCDLAGRITRGQTGAPAPGSTPVPGSNKTNGRHADAERGSASEASGTRHSFGPIDTEGSSPDNVSLDNIALEQGYLDEAETLALASATHGRKLGVAGMLDGASLADCLVHATVENLCLLPATGATTRHIGMMSDGFIRRLIEEARGSFDLVLFDTGPIPGSVEALLVTSQVDGVIVVVPQGESGANLNRTVSYLKVVDAKITGTVFNKAAGSKVRPARPPAPRNNGAYSDTAAFAADRRQDQAADGRIEAMEAEQLADEDDGEFMEADAHLGSGILAAAVFSDSDSGFANKNWQLAETSEFKGSVDDLFGPMADADDDATPNDEATDRRDA